MQIVINYNYICKDISQASLAGKEVTGEAYPQLLMRWSTITVNFLSNSARRIHG